MRIFNIINFLLFSIACLNGQSKFNPSGYTNLVDLSNNFDNHWKGKAPYKGSGYKQFKRWQWYMKDRVKLNGELYSLPNSWREITHFNELKDFKKGSRSTANWQALGPSTSSSGYSGIGRINCIEFHPSNENQFYIGTAGSGFYMTNDAGTTWQDLSAKLPSLSVSDIVVDKSNPNIIYLASGDADGGGNYFGGYSFGVLKSSDGGINWVQTGLAANYIDKIFIYRLVMHPSKSNTLLAATSVGLWRTSDGGSTWNKVVDGNFTDIEIHPNNPNIMYSATMRTNTAFNGFYISSDEGQSWSLAAENDQTTRVNLAVSKANPNEVKILAANLNGALFGIFSTTDGGQSFNTVFSGVNGNLLGWEEGANDDLGQGTYDLSFAINPTNANEFFVGGVNTWKSLDGGNNYTLSTHWAPEAPITGAAVVHADKHNIVYHPLNPNKIYQANDGGIYVSQDKGVTWKDLTNGLILGQVYRSDYFEGNFIAGHQDNGTKRFNNNIWDDVYGGDGMDCAIDYQNKNTQYATTPNGSINRTDNNWASSKNISEVILSPNGFNQKGAWVTPYVLHPTKTNIIVAGFQDVFISKDKGDNWEQISSGLAGGNSIDQVAVSPFDENVIFASSGLYLYATPDRGVNWFTSLQAVHNITSIRFSPTNPGQMAISIGGFEVNHKIYISDNYGVNWTNISANLPNIPTNCVTLQDGQKGNIYAGNDFGVYVFDVKKATWELFSDNLPLVPVTDMTISAKESKMYISTYGRGMWVSDIKPASIFSATPSSVSVPSKAGTFQVEIKSNQSWTITYSDNHQDYDILKTNTGLSGTGDKILTLEHNKNTKNEARSGKLIISSQDGEVIEVNITQEARVISFAISPTNFSLPAAPEGCDSIEITSDSEWKITFVNADPNFEIMKSIEPIQGVGDAIIKFCFNENALPAIIGGAFVVITPNGEFFIPVNQATSINTKLLIFDEPNLNYKNTNLIIPSSGGNESAFVLTNDPLFKGTENFIIKSYDKSWLKVNKFDATTFAPFRRVEFKAEKNEGKINRYALVKVVYNNGQDSASIIVSQPAEQAGYLNVEPAEILLNNTSYSLSDEINLIIKSDQEWTVEENEDWISLDENNGSNNGMIGLTITQNDETSDREASILIKTKSSEEEIIRVIKINQLSRSTKKDVSFSASPNPSSDFIQLNFETQSTAHCKVSLLSTEGKTQKVLFNEIIPSGKANTTIDISDLPSGIYHMCTDLNSNIEYRKWVIIK